MVFSVLSMLGSYKQGKKERKKEWMNEWREQMKALTELDWQSSPLEEGANLGEELNWISLTPISNWSASPARVENNGSAHQ
jgi:hypothetical protein